MNESRNSLFGKWVPFPVLFDLLAWAGLWFVVLYVDASPYWFLLIVVAWVTVRVLLFRRRCINEGLWRIETPVQCVRPTPPDHKAEMPPMVDAEGSDVG